MNPETKADVIAGALVVLALCIIGWWLSGCATLDLAAIKRTTCDGARTACAYVTSTCDAVAPATTGSP